MIAIAVIFSSLFFIGSTTEQVANELENNSRQAWSILGIIVGIVSGYFVLAIVFGIIALVIWSWYNALKPEPSYGGGY